MCKLVKIDASNWKEALQLKTSEDHKNFVAPNLYSIAEAHYTCGVDCYGIYVEDKMVGLTMFGIDATDEDEEFWIWRLMISEDNRKKGYGEKTLQHIITIARNSCKNKLFLSVEPNNDIAINLYKKTGFKATGIIEDGEETYILDISKVKTIASIIEIDSAEKKSEICRDILKYLPEWFGIPEAYEEYVEGVREHPFYAAVIEEKAVGFISIEDHNSTTSEIYVMGILRQYHNAGIGTMLLNKSITKLRQSSRKYLLVKTIAESHKSKEYAITRKFYYAKGFLPLEVFPELWDPNNPCLNMILELC